MDRVQKEKEVAFLREELTGVESVILTSLKGLNMAEIADLRSRYHEAKVEYRVIKNTLAIIAIKDTPLDVLSADFKGETAIAWSKEDPVSPAKITMNYKKDNGKFTVKSGFQAGVRLDNDGVKALADMPSLEELQARLLGVLNAVPAKLLSQINAPAQNIVGIIEAKSDKDKEEAA